MHQVHRPSLRGDKQLTNLGKQLAQYGFTTLHFLAQLYLDFGIEGHVDIDARAEFDEAKLFALAYFVAFVYIPHNAAGHGAGYLPE